MTFTPQRDGIPQPQTVTGTGVFYTTSGLTPDVTYRLQVVAVLNGVESAPIGVDFTTLPDGEMAIFNDSYPTAISKGLEGRACCNV